VSYPASQNGGTTSATVHYTEVVPVDVNIHVDTNPFDNSVEHCGNNVNLLTAAVVATESAEIISKELNSQKVANTIIGGFFSYIRSEISQQIAELSLSIDAQTMHLKELMQSCRAKSIQMEGDFNRIASRYVKIFDDLNNELSNRIFALDKPAFTFKKETDNQKTRTSENDLVSTVAIFGKESSDLQSKISASIAKKRALDTLNQSKLFLWQQKKLNTTIQQSMINENIACSIYLPVCFIETNNISNQINKSVFSTNYLSVLNEKSQKNELIEQFSSNKLSWSKLNPFDLKNISLYFNTELNNKSYANDPHSLRVREMIQKIATINSINAINIQHN
ncbi:MAG: hypothetical protein Q7U54_21575, partial [Bacteroidales bacterium]|nr:hypothetical protein [Bacteroidales bacterium]